MRSAIEMIRQAEDEVNDFEACVTRQSEEIEKLLSHFVKDQYRLVLKFSNYAGVIRVVVEKAFVPNLGNYGDRRYPSDPKIPYTVEKHLIPKVKELILKGNLDRFLDYLVRKAIPAHMSGYDIPSFGL